MWSSTDKNTDKNSELDLERSYVNIGLMAKFRQKLFASRALPNSTELLIQPKREISLSRTAELLLISRLKARSPRNQTSGMLERAAHIVFVTCQNWFSTAAPQKTPQRHRSI